MNLKSISSKKLHDQTSALRIKEKEILSQIIDHLQEISHRRSFVLLGYKSLFEYLVKGLGYSDGAAGRRIQALKICHKRPELEKELKKGEMSLTNFTLLGQNFDQLPEKKKPEAIDQARKLSSRDLEKLMMDLTGHNPPPKKPVVRRSTPAKFRVSVEISEEAKKNLDKVKGLHKVQGKDLNLLFEEMIAFYLKAHSPEFSQAKTRKDSHRSLTPALKSLVWKKAQGQCQFPGCSSTYLLEVEHRKPRGKGGSHQKENLKLYCRAHNVIAAEVAYGQKHMRPFLKES